MAPFFSVGDFLSTNTVAGQLGVSRAEAVQGLNRGTIPAEWVHSGDAEVRNRLLWKTADHLAYVVYWECGEVEFTWHYTVDEALVLVAGEAFITDASGVERHCRPGDTAFFAAGTTAHWRVPDRIAKVAFVKDSIWFPLAFACKVVKKLKGAFTRRDIPL